MEAPEYVIRVVDIETTGLEPPAAEVIELGWQDVHRSEGAWVLFPEGRGSRLYGCDTPPTAETMAVHHIMPEELEGLPKFTGLHAHAATLRAGTHEANVYAAHNAAFEASFLAPLLEAGPKPVPWLCTYKAALRVWPEAPSHGNQALMYWLDIHKAVDIERRMPPHRAEPDAFVTAHILLKLLEKATVKDMVAWSLEPPVLPRCTIGEHRGKPWPLVDSGFLHWMINKPVEPDLVWNARRELERRSIPEAF